MARYACNLFDCTLSLKAGANPTCPVHGHPLQPIQPAPGQVLLVGVEDTGCLAQLPNADRHAARVQHFCSSQFALQNFVPTSARGLFDATFSPESRLITITVKLYCNFVLGEQHKGGPPGLADGYAALTPWTPQEIDIWTVRASLSVGQGWDKKRVIRLAKRAWPPLAVTGRFNLVFVKEKNQAHVAADVKKIPPIDPTFFNCGGTFVGLDQIINGDPMQVSKAALTSESGIPVDLQAQNVGIQSNNVIHYNVMAHEFGHMIGLPDEYEDPVAKPGAGRGDNAKAIHKAGTLNLAAKAGVPYAPFGTFTESIMSRGSDVQQHHYITVWEALVAMTKNSIEPQEWRIL